MGGKKPKNCNRGKSSLFRRALKPVQCVAFTSQRQSLVWSLSLAVADGRRSKHT